VITLGKNFFADKAMVCAHRQTTAREPDAKTIRYLATIDQHGAAHQWNVLQDKMVFTITGELRHVGFFDCACFKRFTAQAVDQPPRGVVGKEFGNPNDNLVRLEPRGLPLLGF
jgi:hypothetical protein